MAKFIVRVELHRVENAAYDVLHKKMESAGFSRTLSVAEGEVRLPHAEYFIEGDHLPHKVLLLAELAAERLCEKPSILVTQIAAIDHSGLSPSSPLDTR